MATALVVTPGTSPVYGQDGPIRTTIADLNITSYTTGGDVLLPDTFGMKRIFGVNVIGCPRGYVPQYITSTGKLTIAWDNGTATAATLPEITSTTNVGVIRVQVLGQ